MTRRHFFYGSMLAGAVASSVPSLKAAGYKSPNEKLNVASIGAGGRAASDIGGVAPTENIVALADVDDRSAGGMFQKFEKATKYKDFRVMLDKQKDIDAVIIAIPDHMHACAAMAAMERGKHVYVEKPLTRTIWEARLLTEAAAKYKVATQMGNQGYSNEGARLAAEIIWSGEIGNVTEVHAWTNRPTWPQGLTEIPAAGAASLDARLGPVARGRQGAAVRLGRRGPRRRLLQSLQLARLFRLRLRRAGRHGLPYSRRAEHGAPADRAHQRRVSQEGGRQPLHVPEEDGDAVRVPGARLDARR